MQQTIKLTLPLLITLVTLVSCGGGGGSTVNTGGTGGTGGGTPTAPVWTAGQFSNESQFKNFCVAPRSGADPYNGGVYPDKAGTAMHEKMWLRSWNNRTYLWYKEVTDLDPTSYSISAYFNLLKTKAVLLVLTL